MSKTKILNLTEIIKVSKSSNIVPDILVVCICLLSLGFSVIESRLNNDPHHWGLMYANATQLNQGLIPYKEIFIQYGFLTTWIQAVSLNFLGDTIVSVGIITGVFYAVNIYLSYCLWQKILNKWLSALSALLMFLVHGYIIYPWPNYISYTFLLLSLLFLVNSQDKKSYYLLSGVCLALNVLARQTALVPTLVPIELYFAWTYLISENQFRNKLLINIAMFHLSIVTIFWAFYLYLIKVDAWKDWYLQSVTIIDFYQAKFGGKLTILKKFLQSLILGKTYAKAAEHKTDIRMILYSLIFFNTLILWGTLLIRVFKEKVRENIEFKTYLFLFSSIVLVGYLQSFHIYEIFRLQNASSLGLGLLVCSLTKLSSRFGKWNKLVWGIPLTCLIVLLSQTLLFTATSSVYSPWDKNLLFSHQLREPENIPMFRGKLYNSAIIDYYQNLKQTFDKYSNQLEYLVNYTPNSQILFVYNKFRTVQKSPFYNLNISQLIFPDEKQVISELLDKEKTILVTEKFLKVPDNYCIVVERRSLNISVPKNIAKECENEQE